MKNHKRLSIILSAALITTGIIIAVIGVGIFLPEREEFIQGQVEMTDYRVSGKVPARIREIRVKEGDFVHQGDTLVLLEAPDITAKMQQAEAAYSAAQAQEQKAYNGSREEQIQQAYEMWQKAQAGRLVAEKSYRRIHNLFQQGVMAEQKSDEAKAQFDAMTATEKAARAQYEMAVNGARKEDKAAAEAQRRRAEGAVSEVYSYLEETILLASADGQVSEIYPEPGELVGTGAPILKVTRTDDAWFTFNLREDLLPGLAVGTEATLYLPALDREVRVRVTLLKEVGSYAVWKATKALDNYDLRTFELQARPLEPVAYLQAGMTAILKK